MLSYLVKETIKREKLIDKGDKIIVALSGGPDSVCLLDILMSLRDELDITIYAAHLNHMIRGLDAQKDAMYCSKLCDGYKIPFFLKTKDIPKMAKEQSRSLEDVARQVRYKMLFDLKSELSADKIAVAHNLDDQAETVIMKLFRGSGLQGLRGMDYKRKDGIIRPLMDVYKKDINNYCIQKNLDPRIDKTNLEDEYTRNKIRLKLLPYIEENYTSNIKQILSRTANLIRDDYYYLKKVASETFEKIKILQDDKETVLDLCELKKYDVAIQRRVIRLAVKSVLKDLNNIENVHINDIIELTDKSNNKMICLPKELKVYLKQDKLIFTTHTKIDQEKNYSYKLKINGYLRVEELNLTVTTEVISKQECIKYPTSKFSKAFDFSKINGDLLIRSRVPGDKINAIGLKGSKKIKDVLIDKKIPSQEKDLYPIISDDNGILWLFGYRISEDYKIDENTDQVIRIQFKFDDNRRYMD